MRPRASHCSGGNLRAAWRPLITATRSWLLVCRAPARPRPRRLAPARLCPIRYPPRFGERTGMGRARSGHPIRTAILSYAKHGRSRANAQGRTFLRLFAAAERPGRRIKAYGFGLCGSVFRNVLRGQVDHGLCASAMPSGPWLAANGLVAWLGYRVSCIEIHPGASRRAEHCLPFR